MVNEDNFKGKWKEMKGDIQSQWGKITDDEYERSSGNLNSLMGIIQDRYGHTKDEVKKKIDSIMSRFNDEVEKGKRETRQ